MLRTASADNGGCGMQRYVTSRLGRHRELWHAMLHATSRATPWTVACSVTLRHVSANNVVCSMQCYVTPRHERLRGLRLAVLRYATSRPTTWSVACSDTLHHVSADRGNCVVCIVTLCTSRPMNGDCNSHDLVSCLCVSYVRANDPSLIMLQKRGPHESSLL